MNALKREMDPLGAPLPPTRNVHNNAPLLWQGHGGPQFGCVCLC